MHMFVRIIESLWHYLHKLFYKHLYAKKEKKKEGKINKSFSRKLNLTYASEFLEKLDQRSPTNAKCAEVDFNLWEKLNSFYIS